MAIDSGVAAQSPTNSYAAEFPVAAYEAALGPRVVGELLKATPGEPGGAVMRDRVQLNWGALSFWLYSHFRLNLFALSDKEVADIDIDPLGETIVIKGASYGLPHWCYLSTGLERGDERPKSWTSILQPNN